MTVKFPYFKNLFFLYAETFSKAVNRLSEKQRDSENYQWLPSEPEGQIIKRVSIPNRRLLQDYVTDAPRFTNQM